MAFPNDPYDLGFWPPNHIPGVFTFASLPVVSNLTVGIDAFTSDMGPCVWNGTAWNPLRALSAPAQLAQKAPPLTVSGAPTIVTNASAFGSSQFFKALPNFKAPPNPAFNIEISNASIVPLSGGSPGNYTVLAGDCPTGTGPTFFGVSFNHSGNQLDIVKFQSGMPMVLWVDDVYIGYFHQPLRSNTATAGGAGTITLDAGASATDGFYIGYTVVQGAQKGQITAYVGATKVATVNAGTFSAAAFTLVEDANGYALLSGAISYVNLQWSTVATRKIDLMQADFQGVNIGPNDSLSPAFTMGASRLLVIGDSNFTIVSGPHQYTPPSWSSFGRLGGYQIYMDGEAGTGLVYDSGAGRFNYQDRIAPPAESWWLNLIQATGGTFTVSVTYAGSTKTTGTIAFNAGFATVQTAIQGLTNLPPNTVAVALANSLAQLGYLILLRNVPGAVLTVNTSLVTGSFPPGLPSLSGWKGVVSPRVPVDGSGNPLPFILLVQGSSNDSVGNGVTTPQIQAAALYIAQQVVSRFPTAICIFTGIYWISTLAGTGVIAAGDLALNAAINAGAQLLNPINGKVPFIDTYDAGLGGNSWIFGSGTIAAPSANKNDILISTTTSGHKTGEGQRYSDSRLMQKIKALLGAI